MTYRKKRTKIGMMMSVLQSSKAETNLTNLTHHTRINTIIFIRLLKFLIAQDFVEKTVRHVHIKRNSRALSNNPVTKPHYFYKTTEKGLRCLKEYQVYKDFLKKWKLEE